MELSYLVDFLKESAIDAFVWLFIIGAIFLSLAIIFPSKPKQPLFRKDMVADLLHWFVTTLLLASASLILTEFILSFAYSDETIEILNSEGLYPFRELPILGQVFCAMFITDLFQYFIHRAFHHFPSLWKFHAIHHSSKTVDWLSCVRFHPINLLLYSTPIDIVVTMIGFTPTIFLLMQPFNYFMNSFVHANLNWTLGPFNKIIAGPIFHRWHHTYINEGGLKNFAPTFPILDVLFGTYYMPKGQTPQKFGVQGMNIPDSYLGQMIHPFKKNRPTSKTL